MLRLFSIKFSANYSGSIFLQKYNRHSRAGGNPLKNCKKLEIPAYAGMTFIIDYSNLLKMAVAI